jgi:hypothetical protein
MYNNQFISNLQAQRVSLLEQIHHIDAMLKLNGVSIEDAEYQPADSEPSKQMPYKKIDGWRVKFAALIKSTNRFISINEAASMINEFEPKISIELAKKGITSAKNAMIKDKTIDKFQFGSNNSNTFYGKMGWKNEDGSIKEEHMYNESSLILKPTLEI